MKDGSGAWWRSGLNIELSIEENPVFNRLVAISKLGQFSLLHSAPLQNEYLAIGNVGYVNE